eukprot:7042329-Pyramimonas_sp.AAC.1
MCTRVEAASRGELSPPLKTDVRAERRTAPSLPELPLAPRGTSDSAASFSVDRRPGASGDRAGGAA